MIRYILWFLCTISISTSAELFAESNTQLWKTIEIWIFLNLFRCCCCSFLIAFLQQYCTHQTLCICVFSFEFFSSLSLRLVKFLSLSYLCSFKVFRKRTEEKTKQWNNYSIIEFIEMSFDSISHLYVSSYADLMQSLWTIWNVYRCVKVSIGLHVLCFLFCLLIFPLSLSRSYLLYLSCSFFSEQKCGD